VVLISIVGSAYREKRLTLAKHGRMDVLKINDDDEKLYFLEFHLRLS
jgi:hypothetical protein